MDTGSKVWVTDSKDGWTIATLVEPSKSGKDIKVILKSSNEETSRKSDEIYTVIGAEPGSMKAINDLTRLPALHEAALLQALQERYDSDQIYTSVGPILIAVNPFRKIPKLYDSSSQWINQRKDLPPHVYGLADNSFRAMVDFKGCNQSILVSGESGAGKTETTKHAMQYLTEVSGGAGQDVSSRILQANPLLEAFGNAKTVRNDNSSRFGKLIEMKFATEGRHKLIGAGVTSYLLEKARIVHQSRGERNYHIFYEIFEGASSSQKSKWHLSSPKSHRYLTSSGEFKRADIADNEQFQRTLQAMSVMGFTQSDMDQVFQIVAGILHLGDVDFEEKQGGEACAVTNLEALKRAAELLGVEPGKSTDKSLTNPEKTLADVLCVRRITVQGVGDAIGSGETYVKTLNVQFAREARDALAMALYERLFSWIVWRVNFSMEWDGNNSNVDASSVSKGLRHQYRIGVLDIFGFEVFEDNFFEQLCINYANEQLQKQFNEHVFELEQKMYEAEGVDWKFVEFPDNTPTITMIEAKPIGLLSLIDEECMYPSGGDKTLASKLYQNLSNKSDRFVAPQSQQRDGLFTIKHFAGDVTYTVDGFYRKNKNELRQDAVDLICSSKHFLVRVLLPPDAQEAAGGADASTYFEKRAHQLGPTTLSSPAGSKAKEWESKSLPVIEKPVPESHSRVKSSGRRSALQQTTVSSHFKTQLHSALTLIRASKPHYVRCLKPNDLNRPNIYNRPRVLAQLRYSGVVEVIKVARAGYPNRFEVADFVERYGVLIQSKNSNNNKHAGVLEAQKLVKSGDIHSLAKCAQNVCIGAELMQNKDFQVGKTKVFLRADAMSRLELAKQNKIRGSILLIQRTWRHYSATHKFRRAAKKIQRVYRGHVVRKRLGSDLQKRRLLATKQVAAADFIKSSKYFRRWLARIRDDLKLKHEVELEELLKSEGKGGNGRLLYWWAVPLSVMAGVPTFLRNLYHSNPNLLLILFLACTGSLFGSLLMLDAQRRGVVRRGSSRVQRRLSGLNAETVKKRQKATEVLFDRRFSGASVTSKSPPNSPSSPSRRRFGGIANAPSSPKVEIRVNSDAVKRFAGLQANRKEAMERAKQRADEMLKSGELAKKSAMATASPSKKTINFASDLEYKSPPPSTSIKKRPQTRENEAPKSILRSPPASPRSSQNDIPKTASATASPHSSESTEAKDHSDSLDENEQFLLNHAILSMFLEEQAPEQLGLTDDLLKEFKGREEKLFDKLTEEFSEVDNALKSDETPVWDKFTKHRRQRHRSMKGFFGTSTNIYGALEANDDAHIVTERTANGVKKNRFSFSKKKDSSEYLNAKLEKPSFDPLKISKTEDAMKKISKTEDATKKVKLGAKQLISKINMKKS